MALEIDRILTISTANIRPRTASMLESQRPGFVCFEKGEYGWMIYTPGTRAPKFPDLDKALTLAQKNDCVWLCIDRDGENADGLSVYDWSKAKPSPPSMLDLLKRLHRWGEVMGGWENPVWNDLAAFIKRKEESN